MRLTPNQEWAYEETVMDHEKELKAFVAQVFGGASDLSKKLQANYAAARQSTQGGQQVTERDLLIAIYSAVGKAAGFDETGKILAGLAFAGPDYRAQGAFKLAGRHPQEKHFEKARNLLIGPGFGHPGLSEKETAKKLMKEDRLSAEDAYLAVQAGASLANDMGIKTRRVAQAYMRLAVQRAMR